MKNKDNKIFFSLILILLIIFIKFTHSFVNYLVSINPDASQTEVLSKFIPPLLGAFFSGIVAIIIFYLTKLKEEYKQKAHSKMLVEIIEEDINSNLESISSLVQIIKNKSAEDIVNLQENSTEAEKFLVITSNLSSEIIDKILGQLNKEDYLIIATKIKKFKSLIKSFEMLNVEIKDKENKKIVIERLKILNEYFETNKFIDRSKPKFLILNKNFFYEGVIIVVLYSILNLILFNLFI